MGFQIFLSEFLAIIPPPTTGRQLQNMPRHVRGRAAVAARAQKCISYTTITTGAGRWGVGHVLHAIGLTHWKPSSSLTHLSHSHKNSRGMTSQKLTEFRQLLIDVHVSETLWDFLVSTCVRSIIMSRLR